MTGEFPWKYAGEMNDGLPFNHGIADKWGVIIARFDHPGYARDTVRLMNHAAEKVKEQNETFRKIFKQ